jgi:hypothetical protein
MRPQAACAGVVVERTRVSQVTPENVRHSPRNGFNGFLRALPGDRAFLPPSSLRSVLLKNLMPASGHQDHTTSPSASAPFVKSASASTASRPAAVTIACRPSVGRDSGSSKVDLGKARSGIFLREGLDRPAADLPVGQGQRAAGRIEPQAEDGTNVTEYIAPNIYSVIPSRDQRVRIKRQPVTGSIASLQSYCNNIADEIP